MWKPALNLPGALEALFLPGKEGIVGTSDEGMFLWSFRQLDDDNISIGPARLIDASKGVKRVRLGPGGNRLAIWHEDHAYIYSVPDFRFISRIGNHNGGEVLGPSFSADEQLLAVSRWNNEHIKIWNVASSDLVQTIHISYSRGVTHGHAEFTPDGKWLFVTTMEDLRVYEPGSWILRASVPWRSGGNQQAFLAGGKVVAVLTDPAGAVVHLVTIPDFQELAVLEAASNSTIARLGTSGDGLKLFAVREDGEVDVWNLPLIASGLAELGLDWDAALPTSSSPKRTAIPRFRLEGSAESEN
jgi:hypothetical protein